MTETCPHPTIDEDSAAHYAAQEITLKKERGCLAPKDGNTAVAKTVLTIVLFFAAAAIPAGAAKRLPGITTSSNFLIYYGNDFGPDQLQLFCRFDVVVIHPRSTQVTPAVVASLKSCGVSYVFGYITIGEDDGTDIITGGGQGPVFSDGTTIVQENTGVASFYVDQEWNGTTYVSDGLPDVNVNFGGRFVIPNGDWRWVLNTQRIGGSPGLETRSVAGLQQLAGTRDSDTDQDRTHNFGFDGFFLDTLDTAGPFENSWGYYAWAAEEMRNTVKFIHDTYPDKYVLANRGVFFYNPNLYNSIYHVRPYDFSVRPYIHATLFESYMLDSNPLQPDVSPYFKDNKSNYAPKIVAEANRPDGFTVFSLDYQLNRPDSLVLASIDERAANGWVGYIGLNGLLDQINDYGLNHPPLQDTDPPVWESTGARWLNDVPDRIGVQSVTLGKEPGDVVIQWDTARDETLPIRYNIYQSQDPKFSNPVLYPAVSYEVGDGWNNDTSTAYANKFTVKGLAPGAYYFRVRAQDSTSAGLEEQNVVTRAIVVPANGGQTSNPHTP